MIRIFEIKIKPGETSGESAENALVRAVRKKLKISSSEYTFSQFEISGKSIDARDKSNIRFVYNVDISLKDMNDEKLVSLIHLRNKKIKLKILKGGLYSPDILSKDERIKIGEQTGSGEKRRPVIVGFGPAGMFAGLLLSRNGLRPIIIERGEPVDRRIKDAEKFWKEGVFNPNSNPLFGEGGAGTFSDGKLTTGKNDKRIPYILKEFHEAGAPKEILYAKNPHIGTDVLRTVVRNIREKIIEAGGEIHFNTLMTGIETENSTLKSVCMRDSKCDDVSPNGHRLETESLILAIGHSARATYEVLHSGGVEMEQKPFSIGLRIEHDQSLIDISQYGEDFEKIYEASLKAAHMPPAEYKLSHRLGDGRGVYTFCMCPGGEVITTAAEEGTVSVNGMSEQRRDGEAANSAILVDVRTEDYHGSHPLAGIDFQREYERKAYESGGSTYRAPTETAGEFFSKKSLIARCLPEFAVRGICEALPVFGKKIKGFDSESAVLRGIESGSSSPVRICRSNVLESNISGIYPCGEGAGYAGGITSSAVDGLKCAEAIIEKSAVAML